MSNEITVNARGAMVFLNDAPLACYIVDTQGIFIFLNQFMQTLLNADKNVLEHTSIFSHLSQECQCSFQSLLNADQSLPKTQTISFTIPGGKLSGTINSKWISLDHQSFLLCFFLSNPPSSKNRKANDSIRLQSIIDQTSEMLFFHDVDGQILDINPAVMRQTGYDRNELLNMNIYDIDTQASSLNLKKTIWNNEALEKGPIRIESYHKRKDGSIYPAEIKINRIQVGDKAFIFGLASDISKRKECEKIQQILDESISDMLAANSEQEILSILSERIHKILLNGMVYAVLINQATLEYQYVASCGIENSWDQLASIIGIDPRSLKISFQELTSKEAKYHRSGKVYEYGEGLYDVFARRISKEQCQKLEQFLQVNYFYGIGLNSPHKHLGNIILLCSQTFSTFKPAIEMIVRQASLVLERLQAQQALISSDQRYESLLKHLPGFVYRCKNNPQWTMIFLSEGVYPITGYHAGELIDDRVLSYNDLILPEYRTTLWDTWQECIEKRADFYFEYPIKTKNGEIRWLSEKASGVYSDSGQLEFLEGFIHDVTSQKKALRDLHFQSSILKQIGDFVTATDLDGNIIYANDVEIKTFGKTKNDLLGKSIDIFGCDPKQGATQEEIIHQTLEKGSWKGEVVNFDKEGNRMVLDCRTWIMYDEIGQASALIGVSSNITEIKRMENELRQQEELFRATIEQSYDGIVIIDSDCKILEWNKAQSDLFGFTKEDMLGQSFKSFLHQVTSDTSAVSRLFSEEMGSGLIELSVRDRNGLQAIFEFSTFFIRSSADIMRGFIVRNITAQKSVIQMKERFINMVSHELRTPLVAIQGGIRLLLNPEFENLSEEQSKILNIADRNIIRLSQFVNDVLDFQTISSTHYNLNLSNVSMLELADEAIQMLEPLAKKKGLVLLNRLSEEMPLVELDKDKIILVFTNIISNAIKYSSAGKITIYGRFDEERTLVHVMIRDKGIGIDPEDQKKLFTPFYRSSTAIKSENGGTGLGLSISKEIIEKHQGKIWIESVPKEGTTLHFMLPVRRELTQPF
jgi:PAS domain S-box-containing protein